MQGPEAQAVAGGHHHPPSSRQQLHRPGGFQCQSLAFAIGLQQQGLVAARLEPTALHQQITIEIAAEMGEEHLAFQQGFRAAQRWWPQGRQAVGGAAGRQLVPPHLFGAVLIASHQGDTPAISEGDDAGDGGPDPTDRYPCS